MLIINVFRVVFTLVVLKTTSTVDSYLLIRKRPLGTWMLIINVFRVVFTLVVLKTTSCESTLDTWDQCI